jgi:two-component system LytT family response regulator
MKELKILIADDEQSARELIIFYLNQTAHLTRITQADDGRTTLELLVKEKPDILFLDIKMPELNGIEVLQQRESAPLPAIIFTTAFEEYALPAFDYEATDYLLKPFGKERFDKAMHKAAQYVHFIKKTETKAWLEHLPIKRGTKVQLIDVNDINYFRSQGAYVEVHMHSAGSIQLINTPMYELEASLDPVRFARIHKSVIISIAGVKTIQSLPNGDFMITMKDAKEIRGSRTYRGRIKKIISY